MSRLEYRLGLWGTLALLVFGLGAVDFAAELGTDYGGYFSYGWFITKGLIPYGDFWTAKTPLLSMALAVWIDLFGAGLYAAAAFPLAVTFLTSWVVYLFTMTLQLPRAAAISAALLFAFFAASHGLDPTRNGVIVIAAAAFEMLAVMLAIRGAGTDKRWWHVAAGVLIALAFATRQTAAVIYLPVVIAVVLARGRSQLRQAAVNVVILSVAAGVGVAGFVAYFVLNDVSLATVWDQIYRFNASQAAGHRTKLTWWGAEWCLLVGRRGLLILALGVIWFGWNRVRAIRRGEPLGIGVRVLCAIGVVHLAAIYVSQKISAMYLCQLLPEICVMTAMAGHEALRRAEGTRFGALRRAGVIAAGVALLAWPAALEAAHWRATLDRAEAGGYLLNPANLPSQVLARRVQQLAPRETDRIWIFSASSDALYPFSNRLPAVRMTSVAGLVYVTSPTEFEQWQADFDFHMPRIVLSFYGEDYVRRWQGHPQASHGQTVVTILEIRRHLMATMRRIDWNGQLPEVFVQGSRN